MSGRRAERIEIFVENRLSVTAARLATMMPLPTRPLAGLLAVVPLAATTLYRVAHNVPGPLPEPLTRLAALALPIAVVGPAAAGLILAATADAAGERVGLAFVGGFGLVSLASATAWLPAAVGTTCGAALVVGARLRRAIGTANAPAMRRGGVAALLAAAVAVSLSATAGVAPATLRPLGSASALLGVGLVPLLIGGDRLSLVTGALAAVLTVGLAASVPYVTGAVLLVGGGVVGAPLGLVALAVGGGVAGLVYTVRHGRTDAALGTGLLLTAGVPGTLLRAVSVVVAIALLVEAERGERA
jgi:hypothetical protein